MLKLLIWVMFLIAPAEDVITLSQNTKPTQPIVVSVDTKIIGNNYQIDASNLDYVFEVKQGVVLTIENLQFSNLKHFAKSAGIINMTNESGKWREHRSNCSNLTTINI